jgi:hypothetical protein
MLYFRFPLSFRDVEDLLAQRGIDVSYETVRRWSVKFGLAYARLLAPLPTTGLVILFLLFTSCGAKICVIDSLGWQASAIYSAPPPRLMTPANASADFF